MCYDEYMIKQWHKFRIFSIGFLLITCGFIIWVILQDNIQVWQILLATGLVFVAFILTFINRRLEQKSKKATNASDTVSNN